jgi:hypothetical protein
MNIAVTGLNATDAITLAASRAKDPLTTLHLRKRILWATQ